MSDTDTANTATRIKRRTANRRLLKLEKLVPHEPDHEAGLAHGRVAQQDELEVVCVGSGGVARHGGYNNSTKKN